MAKRPPKSGYARPYPDCESPVDAKRGERCTKNIARCHACAKRMVDQANWDEQERLRVVVDVATTEAPSTLATTLEQISSHGIPLGKVLMTESAHETLTSPAPPPIPEDFEDGELVEVDRERVVSLHNISSENRARIAEWLEDQVHDMWVDHEFNVAEGGWDRDFLPSIRGLAAHLRGEDP